MNFIQIAIFYLSYLLFVYISILAYFVLKNKEVASIYWVILIVGLVLGYARFIEPQILITKIHKINLNHSQSKNKLRIVVFSDTHFGLFKNVVTAQKIVKKVNSLNPDLILIPGDFLYELSVDKVKDVVLPFKNFKVPAYAVTGNHDEGAPGPNYEGQLVQALQDANVIVLNNKSELYGDKIKISGLSDLWAGNYESEFLEDFSANDLNILISHNPDMAYKIKPKLPIHLIVSGHTHGGQIRIPFLYKSIIPTTHNFDLGFYKDQNSYNVFVTSGTGMVGLPFRFLMPPRLDVLNIEF